MQGKKLFNDNFGYFNSPMEVEAYRIGAEEAKRIGMSKKEIIDYMKVERSDQKPFVHLIKALSLE
jgi:hypothetical protein